MSKSYAITWDSGYRNLMVATADGLEAAKAAVDSARADAGIAAESPEDLNLSGPNLVGLFNAISAAASGIAGENAYPTVSRFATRSDGQRRVFGLLEEKFKTAPEAAAPPASADPAAEPETTTQENEVASKGKKAKAAKKPKKERAAKPVKVKKENGAKALVREESSRGKLLKLAVENPGISLASIASRAGVSGEGSMDAKGRARMRLRKVAENVGATVTFDGEKVESFKLPAGTTLDKVFGR